MSSTARRGSFWPNTAQRALLQVALGPLEQAASRWQALQPLDVTTLEPGSFGLLPLLHDRLVEAVPDEPQLPRLAGTYRSIWYRNRLLLDQLETVLALLREQEIDALLVGGAAALLRWYPRLGLRPVAELELAVVPESFEQAVVAVRRAGWQPSGRPRAFVRLRDDDGRVLVVHPGLPPSVAGPAGRDGAYRIVRARADRLEELEGTALVLDGGDELLFVCATGARVVLPRSCQWLVDVHNMIHSGRLPPVEQLLARARHFHVLEPLRESVLYLAELLGSEGLEEYLAALDARPRARRDRLAFVLAGVGGRRMVAPAQALANHLQVTADEPLVRVVTRLPRTVQEAWVQPGAPERSRSASS